MENMTKTNNEKLNMEHDNPEQNEIGGSLHGFERKLEKRQNVL